MWGGGGGEPESSPKRLAFSSQLPGHDGFRAWATRAPFRRAGRDVFLEKRDPDDAHDACCRGGGEDHAPLLLLLFRGSHLRSLTKARKPVVHGTPMMLNYDAWCRGGEEG